MKELDDAGGAPAFPLPESFEDGFPEKHIASVLLAWSRKDWRALAGLATKDWREGGEESVTWFEGFGAFIPVEAKNIKMVDVTNQNEVLVTAAVRGKAGSDVTPWRLTSFTVVREDKVWGFDPIGVLEMEGYIEPEPVAPAIDDASACPVCKEAMSAVHVCESTRSKSGEDRKTLKAVNLEGLSAEDIDLYLNFNPNSSFRVVGRN